LLSFLESCDHHANHKFKFNIKRTEHGAGKSTADYAFGVPAKQR